MIKISKNLIKINKQVVQGNFKSLFVIFAEELYQPPEYLRQDDENRKCTIDGDVYSFAIILYEMIGQKGPYSVREKNVVDNQLIDGQQFYYNTIF